LIRTNTTFGLNQRPRRVKSLYNFYSIYNSRSQAKGGSPTSGTPQIQKRAKKGIPAGCCRASPPIQKGGGAVGRRSKQAAQHMGWPLQDILLLVVVCARINHPFILPARVHCPHCCNTIARLLGYIRPALDFPFVCHKPYNINNNNIV